MSIHALVAVCILSIVSNKLFALDSKVVGVSELYSFATKNPDRYGTGFFIDYHKGSRDFVVQDYNDPDNFSDAVQGTDLGNLRKAILDVVQETASLELGFEKKATIYALPLAGLTVSMNGLCQHGMRSLQKSDTLHECEAGHTRLTSDAQLILAKRMLKEGKQYEVNLVEKKNIKVIPKELSYNCNNVVSVSEITQTTGGSVYLFAIKFKDGTFLNVNAVVGRPDSVRQISEAKDLISNHCLNHDVKMVVKWHIYQEAIYTLLGTFSGTITNPANLSLR